MQNIERNCGVVKAVSNFGTRFFFGSTGLVSFQALTRLAVVALASQPAPSTRVRAPRLPSKKISENSTIDSAPGRQGAEVECGIDQRWAV
jgi:hypothetical protein